LGLSEDNLMDEVDKVNRLCVFGFEPLKTTTLLGRWSSIVVARTAVPRAVPQTAYATVSGTAEVASKVSETTMSLQLQACEKWPSSNKYRF
jgi:hypothetical protein